MGGPARIHGQLLVWLAILALGLVPLAAGPVAQAQDGTTEPRSSSETEDGHGDPATASQRAATTASGAAGAEPLVPPTPPPTAPPLATGSGCSGAYGLYADSTGHYATSGCAAADIGPAGIAIAPACAAYPSGGLPAAGSAPAVGTAPTALLAPAACQPPSGSLAGAYGPAAPCQLFASASQPTTSSLAAPVPGAAASAPAQTTPACPAPSTAPSSPLGSGVPACQLYPSASQPTTSTFGAANYPVTPVPAPAQVTPPHGILAGAGC
ncbi:MAG TPA: hypothetical protein VK066_09330 [Chloroflexota bacterium]|nr:hypothetical protein [Chloroflexota bacterium]